MAKAIKTNVLRHLDALKIPYETREYTVDDDNFDGKLVAEKVDLPAEMIYKTLVLVGDTLPHLVCVIPVELELDLKAVARAAGDRVLLQNMDMLALHLAVTHQITGCGQGCQAGTDDICGFMINALRLFGTCKCFVVATGIVHGKASLLRCFSYLQQFNAALYGNSIPCLGPQNNKQTLPPV